MDDDLGSTPATDRDARLERARRLIREVEAVGIAFFDRSTLSSLARNPPPGTELAIERASAAAGLDREWRDLSREARTLPDGLPWYESDRYDDDMAELAREIRVEIAVRLLPDGAIEAALRDRSAPR